MGHHGGPEAGSSQGPQVAMGGSQLSVPRPPNPRIAWVGGYSCQGRCLQPATWPQLPPDAQTLPGCQAELEKPSWGLVDSSQNPGEAQHPSHSRACSQFRQHQLSTSIY